MTSVVREFHEAFRLPAPDQPPLRPDPDLVRLRARLIREEFEEVMDELGVLAVSRDPERILKSLRNLLKELSDLRYVTEGCAVSLGLPMAEAYAEVHRSNMSKLGPDGQPLYRQDGKVLKGPNYTEADMVALLPDFIDIPEEDITDE
jgi:predicted HAD superfamily Cof-like phosphohydrolase